MVIEQVSWREKSGWTENEAGIKQTANLVFVYGSRDALETPARYDDIKSFYPNANILLCSTAGEIIRSEVWDDSIVVTAIYFERTKLEVFSTDIASLGESYEAGRNLAGLFPGENLKHIFVISDGQLVNGSELVRGISDTLPPGISMTGGLAGDGARFQKTLVGLNDYPAEGKIVAVGFYGNNLKVGYSSIGGWDSFGPERLITKSENNILYELDGQSALGLYKKYLGELAVGLPGTALLFPLSIKVADENESVVRTILSIDEEKQSMTFAGNILQGAYAQLMKANFDRLIEGASIAATNTSRFNEGNSPDLAILISCVGRKLVLGQRTEEEVEAIREVIGSKTVITGFYSYGEISPFPLSGKCQLHNQTMTITTFSEGQA